MLLPNAIALQLTYKKAVPCHRLDKSTGGLVVCSKSQQAHLNIMKCFRNKWVRKMYIAIVAGRLEPALGRIDNPIGGKESLTLYQVVAYTRSAQYKWISTVRLWPVTGRKHQLRRHLADLKYPIIGDRRYSFASSWPTGISTQFLWSVAVSFPHPRDVPLLAATSSQSFDDNISEEKSPVASFGIALALEELSPEQPLNFCDLLAVQGVVAAVETVHVSIPEPLEYESFRTAQESAWYLKNGPDLT